MGNRSRTHLDRIRHGWAPVRVGRRIVWLDETTSTNTVALDMAATEVDPDGLVVLADYQTAGRGRQGRRWLSPRGASVLCSVVIMGEKGAGDADIAGRLTILAAVTACEAIADSTELRAAIKWPNDLRISDRKVGGILIESRPLDAVGYRHKGCEAGNGKGSRPLFERAWVIGFGINCLQHAGHFPPELVNEATSLELAASHPIDRLAVIRSLLGRLDSWLTSGDWLHETRLHVAWESMAEPIGQRIKLRLAGHDYCGRTVSVDPVGGLTVQLDNGRQMWFDPMLTSVVP